MKERFQNIFHTKEKRNAAIVVIVLTAVIVIGGSIALYKSAGYDKGQTQGYNQGYQTGYENGLASKEYAGTLSEGSNPYKIGTSAFKGFSVIYPDAYKKGYFDGQLDVNAVTMTMAEHKASGGAIAGVDKKAVTIGDNDTIATMYTLLTGGKRTRYSLFSETGMNDTPLVSDYIRIDITSSNIGYRFFVYADQGAWYVEEPYAALYKIDENAWKQIIATFTDTLPGSSTIGSHITAVSGNQTVSTLAYPSPSQVLPGDVKDKIEYLKIDRKESVIPFRVFAGDIEQFGHYEIYDAETFEKLDFISPSGLAPQTFILHPMESGHSYIIELSVGEWDEAGANITGEKYFFGVTTS